MTEPTIFTRGRITWEGGGAPEESISLGLGDGCLLYCGPVAGKRGPQLVAYAAGEQAELGPIENMEAMRKLIERLAEIIAPNREAA
ncbi:hypothetical protein A7A08_01667 [Methyloligella halotolerans]|uniref:Uncharacterized protein n=1 Tax=Methyloligella halotolerans TaxID=1177755 RepID=A0A1E2RZQ3_9HYPH|nr:hypothetical protein [Methyloligella halotolerans]ODA67632.1 hypothetical protein A7A08_01667 [Methyloligella halotolerans]